MVWNKTSTEIENAIVLALQDVNISYNDVAQMLGINETTRRDS